MNATEAAHAHTQAAANNHLPPWLPSIVCRILDPGYRSDYDRWAHSGSVESWRNGGFLHRAFVRSDNKVLINDGPRWRFPGPDEAYID